MPKPFKSLLLLLSLSFLNANPAHSASLWIGGQGGMEKADKTSFAIYGGSLGFTIAMFGLGAHYLMTPTKDGNISGISTSVKHTLYLIEPMFMLGSSTNFHAGLKGGISKTEGEASARGTTISVSNNDAAFGPSIGADFGIAPFFSLGVEASYLYVFANKSYQILMGVGTLKFWL